MNITLFASISLNGKVLLAENPLHQVPNEMPGDFIQRAVAAGCMIIGRKTYEMIAQFPAMLEMFKGVEIIIISSNENASTAYKVMANEAVAMAYIQQQQYDTVLIGGGTSIYNTFLQHQLVNTMVLNYVPVMSGTGGQLGDDPALFSTWRITNQSTFPSGITQITFVQEG
ncbi:dihydrofolate reductase [Chitinophaga skermanii]|uniref:Dihydrofolate reductase n=1 Tax=Chitinophaga skermanii TaxID=331697 RepID=A0A327QZ19_9BACT|nr:dihydrofolate reductase [Chitinophaga skermanii]RAJ08673.1 dihydrofolate reductase [Chitinophaga skermanii]